MTTSDQNRDHAIHNKTYLNFLIRIDANSHMPNHFEINVIGPGRLSGEGSFALSDSLRAELVAFDPRAHGRQRTISAGEEEEYETVATRSIQDIGAELFSTVFTDVIRDKYRDSKTIAKNQPNTGLRLQLHFTDKASSLTSLPWELLYDAEERDFVSLSGNTIVRYLGSRDSISDSLQIEGNQLRILCMSSDPEQNLNDEEEARRIKALFEGIPAANNHLEVEWFTGATYDELQERLNRDGPWHIFHFSGHGRFDDTGQQGAVQLTRDEQPDEINADQLARLLKGHEPLRFVFLNSCDGATGNETDRFSSLVATLINRGLPAVLAMQYPISDEAAIHLAEKFYNLLATMPSVEVDTALVEARKSLEANKQFQEEWITPVLYMHTLDGRLFPIPKPAPSPFARWWKPAAVVGAVLLLLLIIGLFWLLQPTPPQKNLSITSSPPAFVEVGTSITLQGVGANDRVVTLKEGSQILGSSEPITNEAWEITVAQLKQGKRTLTVTYEDGDEAALDPIEIIVWDQFEVTGPENGRYYLAGDDVQVQIRAGTEGTLIEIVDSNGDILKDTTLDGASWSPEIDDLDAGLQELTVKMMIDGHDQPLHQEEISFTIVSQPTIEAPTAEERDNFLKVYQPITFSGVGTTGTTIRTQISDNKGRFELTSDRTVDGNKWKETIEDGFAQDGIYHIDLQLLDPDGAIFRSAKTVSVPFKVFCSSLFLDPESTNEPIDIDGQKYQITMDCEDPSKANQLTILKYNEDNSSETFANCPLADLGFKKISINRNRPSQPIRIDYETSFETLDWRSGSSCTAATVALPGEAIANADAGAYTPVQQTPQGDSPTTVASLVDENGTVVARLEGHEAAINALAINNAETIIVTASEDQTVRLWEISGALIERLEGHATAVEFAVFSTDDNHVITADRSGEVRIWTADGVLMETIKAHEGPLKRLMVSEAPRTRILSVGEDGRAHVWGLDGQQLATYGNADMVIDDAAISADGDWVVVTTDEGRVFLYSLIDGTERELEIPANEALQAFFRGDPFRVAARLRNGDILEWNKDGTSYEPAPPSPPEPPVVGSMPQVDSLSGFYIVGVPITLTGSADPQLPITVTVDNQSPVSVDVSSNGRFAFDFSKSEAGSYEVTVAQGPFATTVDDLVVYESPTFEVGGNFFIPKSILRGRSPAPNPLHIVVDGALVGRVEPSLNPDGVWELRGIPIITPEDHEISIVVLDPEDERELATIGPFTITVVDPMCTEGMIVENNRYEIGRCESIAKIAARLGISFEALIAANAAEEKDLNVIQPGDILNLP